MSAGPEARLAALGIELPAAIAPAGRYSPARRHGDHVYVSGHGPFRLDGTGVVAGKVGDGVTPAAAREAARLTALHMLASLRAEIGSLDRVRALLRVFGMVNCAPGFTDLPAVIDGCSELLVEVFGEDLGRHARSAVGLAELPMSICVEIEMLVAVA